MSAGRVNIGAGAHGATVIRVHAPRASVLLPLAALLALVACTRPQPPGVVANDESTRAARSTSSPMTPGPRPDGRTLLPNGWSLSPVGRSLAVGELPLNLDLTPDGKRAVVTMNGVGPQGISILDAESWSVAQTLPMRKAWLGLRVFDRGRRFAVSGGHDNRVFLYDLASSGAALRDSIVFGAPWPKRQIGVGGIDVDPSGERLFACGKESDSLYVADLATLRPTSATKLPGKPYTCLCSARGNLLYVSLWGRGAIALLDRQSLALVATIPVGAHPNDMVESRDGRLFVADANQNRVSVIDVAARRVIETISCGLDPDDPPGSTPNSVALSNDGARLYVANADNNCLAVIDVSEPRASRSLGFIPVGWYPTCVRVSPTSGALFVTNGKGDHSLPDPEGPNPASKEREKQYIGSLLSGTVSTFAPPSPEELRAMTERVYENRPRPETRVADLRERDNPIPARVGDASPIKHVFYVIKENRTYDQVFGDLPQGNGDPTLCLFPRRVSPNHHALAEEFVLLDNVYADAEVSADGHNWSMAAYATDYVEKTWPTLYGGRGGDFDYQAGSTARPLNGYLWDACLRRGVSFRSYGEFASNAEDSSDPATADSETLEGHVAPGYRCWDLDTSDTTRVRQWREEFDRYDRDGGLPSLCIFSLPNDHTSGTNRKRPTPNAYVGQNDLALGQLVDRISHSRYWAESAIFVIEDDAQDGPDHVDAHRTVALVISPYTRRHFVDHSMYSTSSLVRTIGLILGLPPLSQYDAAALPMVASFTGHADATPYDALPPGVDILEMNQAGAYGQERSEEMNFAREDRAPDLELNDIVWHAVRGASAPMPAPVRSAFVLTATAEREGEDDD
ncbi:MAG: alkaline phosphatase family protein [Candidatus Eisenbacteria bacterium]